MFEKFKLYLAENYLVVISRVFVSVLVVASIVFLLLAPPAPPPNSGIVAREVRRLGHDTTDIYFTLVENTSERDRWVFKSSQPIRRNGEYIEQWMVIRVQLTPGSMVRHFLTPMVMAETQKEA